MDSLKKKSSSSGKKRLVFRCASELIKNIKLHYGTSRYIRTTIGYIHFL